jgi:hypothetical protein
MGAIFCRNIYVISYGLSTTGKLGGCYFSLVLFSKSALRLILKIKLRFTKTTA